MVELIFRDNSQDVRNKVYGTRAILEAIIEHTGYSSRTDAVPDAHTEHLALLGVEQMKSLLNDFDDAEKAAMGHERTKKEVGIPATGLVPEFQEFHKELVGADLGLAQEGTFHRAELVTGYLHEGPESILRLLLALIDMGAFKKGAPANKYTEKSISDNVIVYMWHGVDMIDLALAVCAIDLKPEASEGLGTIRAFLEGLAQAVDNEENPINTSSRKVIEAHLAILRETAEGIRDAYHEKIESEKVGAGK